VDDLIERRALVTHVVTPSHKKEKGVATPFTLI